MLVREWWERDAFGAALRILQRLAHGEGRTLVVACLERSIDVAGADPDLQDHRRIGRLGQLETFLHGSYDGRQIGSRIEKPELGLRGEGVGALLHDRRALAVILAEDDHRAAHDAAR